MFVAILPTGAIGEKGILAGQVLVQTVRAITSLKVAAGQLTAAGLNTAFGGLIEKIR